MEKVVHMGLRMFRKKFRIAEERIKRAREFYAMQAAQKEADDRKDKIRLVK